MQRALISFIRAVDRQVGKSGIASIPNKDCVHGVVMKSNISIVEWTLRAMNISFVENPGRLYPRERREARASSTIALCHRPMAWNTPVFLSTRMFAQWRRYDLVVRRPD